MQGRKLLFNEFIFQELNTLIPLLNKYTSVDKLSYSKDQFGDYGSLSVSSRRRLVVDTRKLLHSLEHSFIRKEKSTYPKLNLNRENYSQTKIQKSLTLLSRIENIHGVGIKTSEAFSRLNIFTVQDLILYFPRDYIDYSLLKRISELKPDEPATIVATVRRCSSFISQKKKNISILEIHLFDLSGRIKVTKFFTGRISSNISFLKKQQLLYPIGSTVAVSGLVKQSQYGKTFKEPIIEVLPSSSSTVKSEKIGRLLPLYSLTSGITSDKISQLITNILHLVSSWPDCLSKLQQTNLSLIPINQALSLIHRPTNLKELSQARKRIVFDEFYLLQLRLLMMKYKLKQEKAPSLLTENNETNLVSNLINILPFTLTKAQKRVFREVENDLKLGAPMSRLVQGDVGSGKTVIAILTLLVAVQAKWQGALMAPTEVLAQQHFKNLCKWLPELHVTVDLLTGSTTIKKRKQILQDLSTGNLNIIVGTHALIEDVVKFQRLGVVVIDEQHRFGVNQRNKLLNKGLQPHLLTMTATPIPRTLSLSVHGDLDVSHLDELPPGRKPTRTSLILSKERYKAYDLIKERVLDGEQIYYVLPLVQESEKLDLRSAIDVFNELSTEIFPDLHVGLLHGKLNTREKESVLEKFSNGQISILVSTTVIEVGLDVPEATLMIVDNADRFGLSQLHQLRGRVGRGGKSSECILISSSNNSDARKRLDVLVKSNDGFEISEIDLRLRGPGQVLGTRQSGLPDFSLANLIDDISILDLAREEAIKSLKEDPALRNNQTLMKIVSNHNTRFTEETQLN